MKPVAALCECVACIDGEYQFEGEGAVVWITAPEGQFVKGKKYLVSIKDKENERTDHGHHHGG